MTIDPKTADFLAILKQDLFDLYDGWNEDELKFFFIGPLISLAHFNSEKYNGFTQRKIGHTINDIEISGIVDFLVALGQRKPRLLFA